MIGATEWSMSTSKYKLEYVEVTRLHLHFLRPAANMQQLPISPTVVASDISGGPATRDTVFRRDDVPGSQWWKHSTPM